MSHDERMLEEQVARLVHAAIPPDARVSQATRVRVFAQLAAAQRAGTAPASRFPERLVPAMAAGLLATAVWVGTRLAAEGSLGSPPPAVVGLGLIAIVNIVTVPVAALVVIVTKLDARRRHA
jgi:hypothetical protein